MELGLVPESELVARKELPDAETGAGGRSSLFCVSQSPCLSAPPYKALCFEMPVSPGGL